MNILLAGLAWAPSLRNLHYWLLAIGYWLLAIGYWLTILCKGLEKVGTQTCFVLRSIIRDAMDNIRARIAKLKGRLSRTA